MNRILPEILIIDDEKKISTLLMEFLDDYEEFNIRTVHSGEEALALLAVGPVDICIVDIRLPGIDGLSLIAEAKRLNCCRYYLIYTGSVEVDLSSELRGGVIEARNVFYKPCDMNLILERIRELLREGVNYHVHSDY